NHGRRGGKVEAGGLRRAGGKSGRTRMDGGNSGDGRRGVAHECRRHGCANVRKRNPHSLSGRRRKLAREGSQIVGSFLPTLPIARKEFCSFRNVLRATSRTSKNRFTFARIAGETPHDAAGRQKRRLHFQKSCHHSSRQTGGRIRAEELPCRKCARVARTRQLYRERWQRNGSGGPCID